MYRIFLSTLSLRRATGQAASRLAPKLYFYPRSPCGERPRFPDIDYCKKDFYPRSPCGERPMQVVIVVMYALFLSTLSLRRATLLL